MLVCELAYHPEVETPHEFLEVAQHELAADLGENLLSGPDLEGAAERSDVQRLRRRELREDLDPLPLLIIAGDVLDVVEIEPGVQLAIHPLEQILRELRRDPRRIVVRRLEHVPVLHQVHADEEVVSLWRAARQLVPERIGLRVREIPDRGAEEHRHRRRVSGEEGERVLVRPHHAAEPHVRVPFGDPLLGACQGRRTHVHRDVLDRTAAGPVGVENVTRLDGAPGAELDQRHGPGAAGDVGGVRVEDGRFRSREIVLGQPSDLVEQRAPPGVVQKPHGHPAGRVRQAKRDGARKLQDTVGDGGHSLGLRGRRTSVRGDDALRGAVTRVGCWRCG